MNCEDMKKAGGYGTNCSQAAHATMLFGGNPVTLSSIVSSLALCMANTVIPGAVAMVGVFACRTSCQ